MAPSDNLRSEVLELMEFMTHQFGMLAHMLLLTSLCQHEKAAHWPKE